MTGVNLLSESLHVSKWENRNANKQAMTFCHTISCEQYSQSG